MSETAVHPAEILELAEELRAYLLAQELDGAMYEEAARPILPALPNPVAAPRPQSDRSVARGPKRAVPDRPPKPRPAPPARPRVTASPAPDLSTIAPGAGAEALRKVREELGDCKRCDLCSTRRNIVFGDGAADAPVLFIGEGPGANEDEQGIPFVGQAGAMLTKMIENVIGLPRERVYIANVVKCRPPGNRNPRPMEVERCRPFLEAQIRAINPRVIVTLGKFAAHTVLERGEAISRMRGSWFEHPRHEGIAVMPTFHPAYLLHSKRDPARWKSERRKVFEDLKLVRARLEAEPGLELNPIGGTS